MTALEEVKKLKNQGMNEEEIVQNLMERKISPREITNALSQARIKDAVSDEEMQPSITNQLNQEEYPQEYAPQAPQAYTPQPQEMGEQMYAPQENYQQYDDSYQRGFSTDTIVEISEQVFSEKIKKLQDQLGNLNEFKTITESKIENFSERLKKIENTIDKLQIAILEKIGSYGANLNSIKKEMSMMQDSFGKIVNPAVKKKATLMNQTVKKKSSKKI